MSPEHLAEHIYSGVACLQALLWRCHAAASEPLWGEALRNMELAMNEMIRLRDHDSACVEGIYVTSDDVARIGRLRPLIAAWLEAGARPPEIETLARECLERLLGPEGVSRLSLPISSTVQYKDSPSESFSHALVLSNLFILLGASFQRGVGGPGGWVILTRPTVWYRHGPVIPDLAAWRADRFEFSSRGANMPVPDWVCEVLSPATELADRGEKVEDYIAHRVRHGWWVDPLARRIEVFRLEVDRWSVAAVFKGGMKVRAEPFAAVELDLSLIWIP